MRVLMFGDIVGDPGRKALLQYLPLLKRSYQPNLILANGENAAQGRGITRPIVRELLHAGVHGITMGNHTWDRYEIFDFIDTEPKMVRPANYPEGTPGQGVMKVKAGQSELYVINLMGRTFLSQLDCPFRTVDKLLEGLNPDIPVWVDFHAETTSEKMAMGWYLAGRVATVVGTHTHVQTADERILAGTTAFLTDVGMTGPYDSILGMDREIIQKKFLTHLPIRMEVASGREQVNAVVVDMERTGQRATRIARIRIDEDTPFMDR
ncbi:TIGR00282 family metallophosphoesterase [Mechercharimyces sp. CAU 1602]|uniref:TIGR00282 family metallophosphoesterase n=1 Tax=Mechercharimyces sp. CAU 1602 TaxID=2973933 RepID=UPI0021637ACA|nr:TIGR00282 family metallophosphoesterase [Mechercharimyces sp. CAU 1602]MCS1351224.1 TIGR00282 family metallophosphoesterase [Mechercharimyces sp. CAU 1602]